MTTDLFFITESGRKVRWFWTRQEAEAHLITLKEVMPQAHWIILTGSQCASIGIY